MSIEGRFNEFKSNVYPKLMDTFEKLKTGQSPHTMVISCSDSRVIPELILNATVGELFVVRNVANIVPEYGSSHDSVAAAVEYAVLHLKVKNIVVIGHSGCGGVAGIIKAVDLSEHLGKWLSLRKELKMCSTPEEAEKLNIKISVENLKKYPAVNQALNEERLVVSGYYYNIFDQTLSKII